MTDHNDLRAIVLPILRENADDILRCVSVRDDPGTITSTDWRDIADDLRAVLVVERIAGRPLDEREGNTGAEYVRADLYAAQAAEIARLTGPHQLCYVNCGLPADECACYRDIMSRDPAVLAALPEVQALIARPLDPAPYDFDIGQLFDAVQVGGKVYVSMDSHIDLMERHSALARIEREAEARGRVKGLREAAEWYRADGWKLDEDDVADAILARADQIEREGGA